MKKVNSMYRSFINQFKNWSKFQKVLALIAVFGSIILTILWDDSLFGLSVTLTGVLCVILVSKRSNWNYFWGTYNVIGYAYLAYTWGLGGDFMLNLFYFLPMQVVGLLLWSKNLEKGSIVKARELTHKQYKKLFLVTIISVMFYAMLLKFIIAPLFATTQFYFPQYDGFCLYIFDSMSTVLSVIAMYLMVKRYAAQWLLWIVVDIASIGMWIIAMFTNIADRPSVDAPAMLLMWTIYLINAIYGFYIWRKYSTLVKEENE